MDDQTLFLVCIVGAVALGGFFLVKLFFSTDSGKRVRSRLANKQSEVRVVETGNKAKDLFQRIGSAASKPFMPETREKMSELRKKLSKAGIYTPAAIKMVTGMKVICLVAGVLGGYLA